MSDEVPVADTSENVKSDPWHSAGRSVFERLDRLEEWAKGHDENSGDAVEVKKEDEPDGPGSPNPDSSNQDTVINS